MRQRFSQAQITLAVASALVIIASCYFGITYLTSRGEKADLQKSVEQLTSDAANAAALAQPTFLTSVPGVELMDTVVKSASASGLEITGIHSSSVGSEPIGKGTYRTARVSAQVRGSPAQVIDFFGKIEQGTVRTLVVDSVDVVQDGPDWQVSLEVVAYAQGG